MAEAKEKQKETETKLPEGAVTTLRGNVRIDHGAIATS